ncbi:MAG: hypothetical protein P4L69_03965 [Desulfosporosinus sp.]|nr:hypothetical protein [Desulfosporosinus sp.]
MEYIVMRWPNNPASANQQATIVIAINATNHLEALELSELKALAHY